MNPHSPTPRLFRAYAFTADGKSDPIAEAEKAAGDITSAPTTPMTPAEFNRRIRRIAPARGERYAGDTHDTCMVIERSKNLNLVLYTANLIDPKDPAKVVESGKGCHAVINAKDPLRTYWLKLEPEHVARRRARGEMGDICELTYIEKKLAYGCHAARAPTAKLVSELSSTLKKTDNPLTPEQVKIVEEWDEYFSPCFAKYVAAPQWPVQMLTLPPLSSGPRRAVGAAEGTSPFPKTDGDDKTAVKKDVGGDVTTAPGFALDDTVTVMLAVINDELSLLKKVYVTSIEPKHFYQLPSVSSVEAFGVSVATGKDTYEKRINR